MPYALCPMPYALCPMPYGSQESDRILDANIGSGTLNIIHTAKSQRRTSMQHAK